MNYDKLEIIESFSRKQFVHMFFQEIPFKLKSIFNETKRGAIIAMWYF